MENFTNPKAPTLVATYSTSISSSTALTLNSGTTYIEVSAIDKGIFLKWDATASSSAFDEFIPADTSQTYYSLGKTTANFIQESATGKLVVLEK